jgi:hypothetical protein
MDRLVVLRSFVHLFLVRSFVWSFNRLSNRSWFVRPFVRSFDRSIVRPFVRPNNLCSVVMLPKFRSFVRPIIWSFVRSFIVPIHRSSFVHSPYSSFVQIIFVQPLCYRNSIVRSSDHPIVCPFVHSSYSSFVHSYYSSFIVHSCNLFIIVTIHRWYLSLLF